MAMAWMRRGKEGGNGMDEEGKRRWKWHGWGGGKKVEMAWMRRGKEGGNGMDGEGERRWKWHG